MTRMFIVAALLFFASCSEQKGPAGEGEGAAVKEEVRLGGVPRMVAVHSGYCSICHEMKPLLDRVRKECSKSEVEIDIVDISSMEDEHLIDEYRVVALPTYLFIDQKGHEAARLVGAQTDAALRQALSALTGRECPGLERLQTAGDTKHKSEV